MSDVVRSDSVAKKNSSAPLTKTRFLMEHLEGWTKGSRSDQVFFSLFEDETPEDRSGVAHELQVDAYVWEDMGCPSTITVTIEPGDKLNEGGSDGA